jgi:LmbE family N-acetylglucosaminyl deacetylase
VLGVERVEFLGYPDGELEDTREMRRDVVAQIRKWRPDLIVTQSPLRTLNLFASHRDHRTTGGVVLDCVYPLARDHLSFPELTAQGLKPHKVREVYVMWLEDPDTVIDITDTMDLKLKALACHRSQFGDFSRMEKRVRERAAELGKAKGYAYAETFKRIVIPR